MDRNALLPHKHVWRKWLLGALLFIILQLGLTTAIHYILLGNTPGMDFHIYWVAGRAMHQGISPYGQEVALESQLGVLKRPARADEDQMGFAYPIYALLPVFPTLRLPFDWAQPAWLAFNLLALAAVVSAVFPRSPLRALLLTLTFYPLTFALILGNMNILVTLILLLCLGVLVLQRKRGPWLQAVLGVLLAWATVKPQFCVFFLVFLALCAMREKLTPFMLSFGAALLIFLALSTFIWPHWLTEWLARLQAYTGYIASEPFLLQQLKAFLPASISLILCLILAAGMVVMTFIVGLRWWRHQLTTLHLLAWLGMLSYLSMPQSVSYEQIRFFIPLLIWLALAPRKSAAWWIFGPVYLLFSWVLLAVARGFPHLTGIEEIRFLIFLIWMIWLYTQKNPRLPGSPAFIGLSSNN